MSAILISQITVTEPEDFQAYLTKSRHLAARYNAELLFRGKFSSVLNGDAKDHQLVVIARFPNAASIDAWHVSPEYQALIPLREKGSEQIIVTYEEAA